MAKLPIPKEELFAPGHRGCAGCGAAIMAKLALKAAGSNTIACSCTGCLEVMTTPYPESAWRVPWIHCAFENVAAVASGVEATMKKFGKSDINIIAFGGDGGTFDIGIQSISGAMERGHDFLYICYDNEAYMNTGIQRSGATPYGASTTTSPSGKKSFGQNTQKKPLAKIIAAHNVPYVATANVAYPKDFMDKVKKGLAVKGPAFIHVLAPCPTGWRFASQDTVKVGKLAVETGFWLNYEIENGDFYNVKVSSMTKAAMMKRLPVIEYLKMQGRFKHLKDPELKTIQSKVDEGFTWLSKFVEAPNKVTP